MLSNKNIKMINSLQLKKQRDKNGLYIIEGDKMVREYLMSGENVVWLYAKPEWISSLPAVLQSRAANVVPVSYDDLKKISTLKTPHNSIALVEKRTADLDTGALTGRLSIILDNIQDPGNLGTIIRIAGWFGISDIICSQGCVDLYNPKVIQATMGSLLHVNVYYTDLIPLLSGLKELAIPVFATSLTGSSIYETDLPSSGMILFGNESKGISGEVLSMATGQLMIPSFGSRSAGIDSLNVGMSVAVVCSEFRRRSLQVQ